MDRYGLSKWGHPYAGSAAPWLPEAIRSPGQFHNCYALETELGTSGFFQSVSGTVDNLFANAESHAEMAGTAKA